MQYPRMRAASVLILLASVLVSACGRSQSSAVSPGRPPHHDAGVVQAVEKELGLDHHVASQDIRVTVKHGIAMLRGQVGTFDEARQAAHSAQLATGVRGVINWLHVEQSAPDDSALVARVREALAGAEPAIQDLKVVASAGNVRMDGVAVSLQQKRAAQDLTWSIQGVVGVDNRVRVVPTVRRRDPQIAKDIRAQLAADGFGDETLLVGVEDGSVTLSGEVGSIFEEQRALLRAAVPGVTEVRNHLRVTQREQYRRPYPGIPSALEIRAAILDAYHLDGRVPVRQVRVAIRSGVVTLTGQVSTAWQRFAAKQDAVNAAGAWIVENQLTLPGTLTPDEALERRLEARVEQHPYVSGERLEVDVERGHVTMIGQVLGTFQRETAERVVRLTPGVVSLDNRLTVDEQVIVSRDDSQLERRISENLRQVAEVDPASVRVIVRDGVVTIAGQVANWEAYNAVLEAVFDALPRRVVNRLERRPEPALLHTW
jgi:osmotically-inducible protein OsmY